MGRHSSTTRRGIRPPVLVVSVLLVLGLIGTLLFVLLRDRLQVAGCDTTTELTVVASPDIEPTITAAGREASAQENTGCYEVTVISRDSATTAEALAVSDGTERPDVWIPESTMWLQRAQDKGAWSTPVSGTSIASSPVIFALAEDAAAEIGWPARAPTWGDVIGPAARAMTVGFPDPARDPVGVSTLYGLRELVNGAADPAGTSTATMRRLSANLAAEPSELFNRLPGGTGTAEPLDAFPSSENALLRHNVKQVVGKLVAAYADPAVPALDYPYAVLPDAPADKRAAATEFLDRLVNQQTSEALADAGFRTPDGKALRDRSQDKRVSSAPMTPIKPPAAADVEQLLNSWATVNLSGRVQVLLDVSGSMNEPVPGTDKTRMDVTLQAAITGVGLFKPTTKLGWWLFSTRLDGDRDYTVLLPMRPVAEHVASGAIQQLAAIRPVDGGTGLYDSVLAAYQDARQNWESGRINVVIVLTDGKNDDRAGISLDQLVAELGKLQDPRRPLKIVGIGIGPGIDAAELKTITEVTGGQAFTAADPTKIGDVFFAALGRMLCQPPQCAPGSGGG